MATHGGSAKLGDRLARVISQAVVHTHAKLLHVKHRLAMLIFSDISDIISQEVHDTIGPILQQFHADVPEDGMSHGLVKFMATQHGQLQAMAGTAAGATGLFSSIAQIVNNELSPSVRGALASNPHLIPDPMTVATLAAHGLAQTGDALNTINQNGIDSGWGQALIALNEQYPDVTTMLDLVRRGSMGRDTFIEWAHRNAIPGPIAEMYLNLLDVPISPADAALALLRGNISETEALKAAAAYGVNADSFNVMVGNTGEPLGLQELLEARRRGFIDDARLVRGILQSRTRNEWVDVAKALSHAPMSTADAVEAAVQNHMSQAQAAAIADQNGLEPGMFDYLYQTAGAPLSRTEMEQLFNRGLVTKDQVLQALRESRLKDKYGELAFELHSRLVEPGELADAVVYGSITHQTAVQKAMEIGYDKEGAEILISAAVNRKLETQRMAVVRSIETLYENNAISHDQALSMAGNLGFEPIELDFIFQAAEFRRNERLLAAGMSAIRSKYVAHHINKGEASGLLDALGIPHQQRDATLQIWQIEHDANVRMLTPAQIVKAVTNGLIKPDEGMIRLQNLGYNATDADLLLRGA